MNSRVTYAFHTLKANLTFNFFVPGNNYPDVRWRQDMSEFTTVNANLGFGRGLRESYTTFPNWQSTWGLAGMFYEQTINGKIYNNSTVYVAYSKTDPLERYIEYVDPVTGKDSGWVQAH